MMKNSLYRRNYKYSHPLAGTLYDNQRFVNHCSSFLDSDLKLSTSTFDEFPTQKNNSSQKLNQCNNDTQRMGSNRVREVQSVGEKRATYSREGAIRNGQLAKNRAANKRSTGSVMQEMTDFFQINKNSIGTKKNVMLQQSGNNRKDIKIAHRRGIKRKMAINPFTDCYVVPSINIKIIHKAACVKQIEDMTITMNFEKVFKRLIRTQLMGQFTLDFMKKIEHYLRIIIDKNQMYVNPQNVQLQQSYKTLSKKEELLQTLVELQLNGEQFKIHQLVKYYCIPKIEISEVMFADLMEDIVIELFQKKNCPKDIEYALMTEQGWIITHISQIYFSTKNLLISAAASVPKSFELYKKLLQDHDKQMRMTFKQSIKHNFINKIASTNAQESLINYTDRPRALSNFRKDVIEQAQSLLISKAKRRLQQKKFTGPRQSAPQSLIFCQSKTSQGLMSTYTNSNQKHQDRMQYIQIIERLHKILDPNNKYIVKSKLDQKTEQQFLILHRQNEQYDITYTHNPDNSNKLLMVNLLENCPIFNTKNQKQLSRLIGTINKLYAKPGAPLKEICYWQFKEIYETAHGVSDSRVLMKFVLTYLCFDDFGQLSRYQTCSLLQAAVSGSGRSVQLIKRIVWNWLQRCNLVENNALRKRNLQIWYQPVKVVYLLFLSIMFGTEYRDVAEMMGQMIECHFQ